MILASLGTHSGSFHADEVTAAALLVLFELVDPDKIHRTRDFSVLEECEYVCDVGGIYDSKIKRFDHHQVQYSGSLSSAGMVLKYLKESEIIDNSLYDYFNRALVMGVDAHDNGLAKVEIGYCSFSQVVSNFMPIEHTAKDKDLDQGFFEAFRFVLGHLKRLKERFHYTQACKDRVKIAMSKGVGCLFFEESIPWMENFFLLGGEDHPAVFIIMPSGSHWKLRGIPPSLRERMKVRKPMPAKWAGLHENDLKIASGIEGAIFCHKGRFISIWETKDDALQAMDYILKKSVRRNA